MTRRNPSTRHPRRQWPATRSLTCAIGVALALGSGAAHAATISVDSSADGALGTFPEDCTLRAAIEAANTGAPVDGCTTGSPGADAIVFDSGLAQATITLAAGQLGIFNDLSITGPVADDAGGIVIDGDAQSRLLFIEGATASEFAVGLAGMTLTNGFESGTPGGAVHVYFADLGLDHVTVSNSAIEATPSQTGGAGVYARFGNIELNNVTISGNAASTSAISTMGSGLGIFDGDLTIIDSMITGNSINPGLVGTGSGFHVSDGSLTMSGTTVSENTISSLGYGGGLSVLGDSASALISDSTIANNSASKAPIQRNGGGGLNINIAGTIELTNVIISGNSGGSGGGGALGAVSGLLTNVTVTDNAASKGEDQDFLVLGGGILFNEGDFTVVESTVSNNATFGGRGGGLYFQLFSGQDGSLTLIDSTVSGNSTDGQGGGIGVLSTNLELVNSTISGNASGESGGGILVSGASANLVHATVAFNSSSGGADGIVADQLSLNNSLIFQAEAGQTACSSQATSHSNSLSTDINCTGTATSLTNIALQPLADNGGPTLTHALGAASVAIDAAGDCVADFGIDTDQRGMQRPGIDSSACDIGAFEFQNLFSVSGTVSGLAGTGLVLQNNDDDDLAIDRDGSFTFNNTLTDGATYDVDVSVQPVDPDQFCSVANGSGTIEGADVTEVAVECGAGFTVGGSVSGLKLPGLVLGLDGVSLLLFDLDNDYVFPGVLPDGAAYEVSVELAPNAHDCQIANATGTIAGADVIDADVTCTTDIEFADGFEVLQPEPVELND